MVSLYIIVFFLICLLLFLKQILRCRVLWNGFYLFVCLFYFLTQLICYFSSFSLYFFKKNWITFTLRIYLCPSLVMSKMSSLYQVYELVVKFVRILFTGLVATLFLRVRKKALGTSLVVVGPLGSFPEISHPVFANSHV